jgi:hypothetical protein
MESNQAILKMFWLDFVIFHDSSGYDFEDSLKALIGIF